MVEPLDQCVCPKCGSRGLYVTTKDGWKPREIKCRRIHNCGWCVNLEQFWPIKEGESEEDQHEPDEESEDLLIGKEASA